MRIKRHITLILVSIAAWAAHAQNGINLPYSQFGLGLGSQPFNSPMAARMGGAVYTQSSENLINPYNPASYGNIGMESFVFDMALSIDYSTMRNQSASLSDAEGNVGHLLIAMPITKWWKLSVGLMPYSTVDYESVNNQQTDLGKVRTVYSGNGGASQLYLGSAFVLHDLGKEGRTVQVGFNIGYLTGHVQKAISYDFSQADTANIKNSRKLMDTKLGNLLLDLGLQWREPIGEKYTLGLGLVYKPHLSSHVTDLAYIYTYNNNTEAVIDYIFPLDGESNEYQSTLEQASTFGIGLSIERNKRWMASIDYTFADWNGMKYTEQANIFGLGESPTTQYNRLAVGLEKMGNMDATTYIGRMSWSLGAHREQGILCINPEGSDVAVDGWGVGGGVTMPMRKGKSLLSFSIGYSSMGETTLLQRNCLSIGIGISSCERWFVKRKYN